VEVGVRAEKACGEWIEVGWSDGENGRFGKESKYTEWRGRGGREDCSVRTA